MHGEIEAFKANSNAVITSALAGDAKVAGSAKTDGQLSLYNQVALQAQNLMSDQMLANGRGSEAKKLTASIKDITQGGKFSFTFSSTMNFDFLEKLVT